MSSFVYGQFVDDFTDANITLNPTWGGNTGQWSAATTVLDLNAPAGAGTYYLSTPSAAIYNATWEFHLKVDFTPSGTTFADAYLVSDIPLTTTGNPVNGYMVRISTSGLARFYVVNNGVLTLLITGTSAVGTGAAGVNVKVTRSPAGLWSMFLDNTAGNGTAYVAQGTPVTNTVHTVSNYFGVSTTFIAGRNLWCHFDNFNVTGTALPDLTPPTVTSVVPQSTTSALVTFSEFVKIGALTPGNYLMRNGMSPATSAAYGVDSAHVNIGFTLPTQFQNCQLDSVVVQNVQDRAGNTMVTDTVSSTYFVPGTAAWKTVVLNEIMAAPSGTTCIPQVEYVEIFNRSNFPVDLQNWKIFNSSPFTISASSYPLCPGEYAIICSPANATSFTGYPHVIGVASFGALTNGGEPLSLRSNTNVLVDTFAYANAGTGVSWELVNPMDSCSSNWQLSTNPCGGTPTVLNSVNNPAPDVTAPSITSISVVGSNSILVCFSEPVTSGGATFGNYTLTPGLGAITNAVMSPGNTCVTITYTNPIGNGIVYTLGVSGVGDCAGNVGASSGNFMISGPAASHDVRINEIFFHPNVNVGSLPNVEFVELYNRSGNAYDLSGWKFRDTGSPQTITQYILAPGDYVILCPLADTASYTGLPYIGLPAMPSLNNTGDQLGLRDNFGNLVDSVAYLDTWYHNPNKAGGGWTIELINPNDTCNVEFNWAASVNPIGGTPGAQNSVYSTAPDVIPPLIVSVTPIGTNQVQVCFDQALDVVTGSDFNNYFVSPLLNNPVSAVLAGPTNTCVVLTFSLPIDTGTVYTLTASHVEDCSGNTTPTSGTFLISGPGNWKSVIMNEIFFDPDTNSTNLPNVEYVELFNRSTEPFDLNGWKFRDSSSTRTLTNYVLLPGEYVILCKQSDTAAYAGLAYLGLSSWPTLNDAGDNLGLHDAAGNLIDSVQYRAPLWYHSSNKDGGGWSIELINPMDSCNTVANWAASNDPDGGTPAALNSIWSTAPDLVSPHISSVTITGSNSVQVCFDEGLDVGTGSMAANYTVDNGLGPVTAATLVQPGNNCVDLTFTNTIVAGTVYTLTATGVEDCSGNDTVTTGMFVLNGSGYFRALLFNEIFADPDPQVGLPDAEYLEIYNPTNTAWDLGGWTLHNGGRRVLGNYVLLPNSYVVLMDADADSLFNGIPHLGLSSWPGLTNSLDQVGLHDANGVLIDTVAYEISWYQNANKEDGGWSLELINPNDSCALLGNWIASNDVSGGTPGRVNSVFNNSPDTTAPTMLGITVIDPTHIEVCFDETMDMGSLETAANYFVDSMGFAVTAVASGFGNACVTLLLPQTIDTGTVYQLTVSNVRDCKGNLAGPLVGQFVLGGNANRYQIVINELFPDESPVIGTMPEAEFVELYNNGPNVVSLKDWTITDRSSTGTLPNFNLFPGEYVILCASGDVAAFGAFGDAIAVASMPGLNQEGDSIELYDANGAIMDFAYYDKTWYHDPNKEEGGWSIERKDAAYPCANGGNWNASTDVNGGTPGAVNSGIGAFTDHEPPTMVDAIATSRSTVRLTFSELMDGSSLQSAIYTLNPGIGQATAVTVNGSLPFSVDLAFGALMDTNVVYCISVTDAKDCPGNAILTPNSLCFGIAAPVAVGDVILNEILFNAYTGGTDYVELYNNSDKIIDLSEVWIGEADPTTHAMVDSGKVSDLPKILLPHTYICLTPDPDFQIATYLPIDPLAIFKMSDLPAYEDTEGECVVFTDGHLELDRLSYLDDWQFPNLDDKNGVSLERLDFNRATQDQDNWHSAATTVRYGTPGYKNSEILVPEGDAEVWLQPETFSPDQDGFEDVIAINYHFLEPDWNVRVMVLDNKGRPVRILKENTLVGTEIGTFIWDGTTDGLHKADVGIYVILLEAMNPTLGEKKHFKLGCVLAAKL